MVDAGPEGRERRVSTGTPGLDAMLEGGLVGRRPYLIVGPSGTGKTTLALQFLAEGIRRRERVLFITMEEPPNEVRINHRLLGPELLKVEVFDAIPDIMRYERVPFKDIASVRQAMPFASVPLEIRRSPELTAVEVTMTALEQMLRSEIQRRTYSRVVIDSLTALQYFCMKGFDPIAGAQAFLRFLSDLRVTTILTVESPLEDVDTPERMLARGEIRLFRWELDGRTVRAIGVEKFRGSSHDVRLHPYRIGPQGIDVNLAVTISRDTRQIIESPRPVEAFPTVEPPARPIEEAISPLDPLAEEVRDLVLVGAEVAPLRQEIVAALRAASEGDLALARGRLSRANALVIGLSDSLLDRMKTAAPSDTPVAEAYQRILQRSEAARAGMPPTKLPPPRLLEVQLEWVLSLLPEVPSIPTGPAEPAPEEAVIASEPAPEETVVASEPAPEETVVASEPAPEEAVVASEPESPPVPEPVPVDSEPARTPDVTETAEPRIETVPEVTEAPVQITETEVSPPASTDAVATEAFAVLTPSSAPDHVDAEPMTAAPEEVRETPPPDILVPVPAEAAVEPPETPPPPVVATSVPTEGPAPPVEAVGPREGEAPDTVEGILGAPELPHGATRPDDTPLTVEERPFPIPTPSVPVGPTSGPEAETFPLPASQTGPAPVVEVLPPPTPRDGAAPVRPLRAWSPPALPSAVRRPAPPPRAEVPASVPSPPVTKVPTVPARGDERRPPLPKSVARLPVPSERHAPLETVRESRVARPAVASVPARPPPSPSLPKTVPRPVPAVPATPPAPAAAPAPVPTSASPPPKRRRKARATPSRKKASAAAPAVESPSLSVVAPRKVEAASAAPPPAPGGDASAPPPTPPRPKRRPARKRKAPTVVVAHPAPAPSSEVAASGSGPPPLPTPPTAPPEESPPSEENR